MARQHHTAQQKRDSLALKAQGLPWCQAATGCLYPGQPIDYAARAPHPLSFSAEHPDPLAYGGDPSVIVPAHLNCNKSGGGKMRAGQYAPDTSAWTTDTW